MGVGNSVGKIGVGVVVGLLVGEGTDVGEIIITVGITIGDTVGAFDNGMGVGEGVGEGVGALLSAGVLSVGSCVGKVKSTVLLYVIAAAFVFLIWVGELADERRLLM